MMLAIPLQGFAAASMLYCGPSPDHHGQKIEAMGEPQVSVASEDQTLFFAGETVSALPIDSHHESVKLPDATHKCGVCASCCNLLGIPDASVPTVFADLPIGHYLEPLAASSSAPLRLLDKPPRS